MSIINLKKFWPIGEPLSVGSSSSSWTPRNVVLTAIPGGFRITWLVRNNTLETEIWIKQDSGTLTLITTTGLGVETYDYLCDAGHDYTVELRAKLDQTVLSVPTGFTAVDQTGGIVRLTCNAVTGADHYVWSANIAGAGHSVIATTVNPTYDYNAGGGIQALYKVRAKEGTLPIYSSYTSEIDITTAVVGIFDADGNEYTEVVVGTQTWLLENLITTKYRDGSSIANLTDAGDWLADTVGAYCWYDNDIANKPVWGALYDSHAVTNAKGICPVGYHIPTGAEWATLVTYLGGGSVAGGKLKIAGTVYWYYDRGDHSSGLNLVGNGSRNGYSGAFENKQIYGLYHQAGGFYTNFPNYNDSVIVINYAGEVTRGQSVRCIKD